MEENRQESPEKEVLTETSAAPENPNARRSGGLYAKVRLSVRGANILVLATVLLLVGAIIFVSNHNGFTVNFDTDGGSSVASVRLMHGETLPEISEPTKEGYAFTGWYTDKACTQKWVTERDTVSGSMTLYAGWEARN